MLEFLKNDTKGYIYVFYRVTESQDDNLQAFEVCIAPRRVLAKLWLMVNLIARLCEGRA